MDKITNIKMTDLEKERRKEGCTKHINPLDLWEDHLNTAQIYTLGRLRGFGYDLKFVRYNSENLAVFSKDKDFTDVITVDVEGDFQINPDIVIRK